MGHSFENIRRRFGRENLSRAAGVADQTSRHCILDEAGNVVSEGQLPATKAGLVCIAYRGRRDCGTAAAQNETDALRTATTIACSQIAGGVIEANQCENTPPESVRWLAGK